MVKKRIGIIGLGTWGTSLAQLLVDNGHDVLIYGRKEEDVNDINLNHQNKKYFGDLMLPVELKATNNIGQLMDNRFIIVIAVPSKEVSNVLNIIKPLIKEKILFVSVAKGFDPLTNKRMSETIRDIIPSNLRREIVSLIGPGHAEEVIRRNLTLVTSTSLNEKDSKEVQTLFSNDYFRVYTNEDEIGAEYGVAIKNVIAIASGCLKGMGLGDNSIAALVTRGLHEMVKLGVVLGGKLETYLGLTGLGDLMVTCNSINSRNFQFGFEVGLSQNPKLCIENNHKTVEGIYTSKVIFELAKSKNIDMPICQAVYEVLFNYKNPKQEIIKLMQRPLKKEIDLFNC